MDIRNLAGTFHWSDRRRLKESVRNFPPVLLFQPPAPHDVWDLTTNPTSRIKDPVTKLRCAHKHVLKELDLYHVRIP